MAKDNIALEGYAASGRDVRNLVTTLQPETAVAADATDLAEALVLLNEIRAILIVTKAATAT